jgi:serine/threonine protein kinase
MAPTPERWQRIEALYHAALERDPATRAAFLDGACGQDADLRREVESLLAEAGTGQALLDRPVESFLVDSGMIELTPGTRLGPYQIEGLIGQGGMGTVYKAQDTRLHRGVAVKTSAERFGDRFEREARAVAALNHPHICALYDVGPNYLVMELIEGPTLAERIKQGAVPLEETLGIALQIAGALEAAHEKGIVHRDLKPANIKINAAGIVKVLDFGLAKLDFHAPGPGEETQTMGLTLTEAGVVMGTQAYMSPEQARAEQVDARTDLFSFGAVLCEMATGRRAFPKALDWATPLTGPLPPELRRIVLKLLEVDREMRYQTAADVGADLKRLQRSRESKHSSRNRWMAAAAALAALAFAATTVFYFRPDRPAGRDQWIQ